MNCPLCQDDGVQITSEPDYLTIRCVSCSYTWFQWVKPDKTVYNTNVAIRNGTNDVCKLRSTD